MKIRQMYLAILIVAGVATTICGQTTKAPAGGVEKTAAEQRQSEEKEDEQLPKDRISIHQLKRKLDAKEKLVIIDTRKGSAWIGSLVKIKGAIHITLDEFEAKMNELPKDQEIITYCT